MDGRCCKKRSRLDKIIYPPKAKTCDVAHKLSQAFRFFKYCFLIRKIIEIALNPDYRRPLVSGTGSKVAKRT